MRRCGAALISVLACVVAAAPQVSEQPKANSSDITAEDLLANPVGANWTSYNGDYTGRRYSSLREITAQNVAHMRAAWIFHPGNSRRLEVTPVVIRGIMYLTAANDVFAVDARTGRSVWHYQRPISNGLLDDAAAHKSRGVAVWRNFVYSQTDDAHLLCLDARSGSLRWDVQIADKVKQYGGTSAPLVVKDEVIVGTSGGDSGVRGFLAAFDAQTGKEKWRFWTIPAAGEPGAESWPGDAYLYGGGTAWMPGTYDPDLNTIYWTTGNPAPDFTGGTRPGDDLYTDCVVALDPDTGKLKWHFQFTPHDLYDFDANETPVIIDREENGKMVHLLVQADRNGFFYVLDRTNGKFLRTSPFVDKLTWAKSIDSSGRPVLTGKIPTAEGTLACPGIIGATNWFSPSYNPDTGLFYVLAWEDCNIFFAKHKTFAIGETYYDTGTKAPPGEQYQKILLALSVSDGKQVWRYPQVGRGDSWGGTLTTAGGLVIFCDDSGSLEAVDATTGRPLWHFNTGQQFHASPMTYAIDGLQYIAISTDSEVFTFSLPH